MKLTDPISVLPHVGPTMEKRLNKLSIYTINDLFEHIPSRYEDFRNTKKISEIKFGEKISLEGQVVSIRNIFTKSGKVVQEGVISDGEDQIVVLWFRQTYLVKTLPPGTHVSLTGKVGFWGKKKALMSPNYEKIFEGKERLHSGKIVPIYPETNGVSSKWIRRLIDSALISTEITDEMPEISPTRKNKAAAFSFIHKPKDFQESEAGRMSLGFDEILELELGHRQRKNEWLKKRTTVPLVLPPSTTSMFISALPYEPTDSQLRAIQEVYNELVSDIPMNRLLEGDVGSGKTLVAAFASFATFLGGASSMILAPTQILAHQHKSTLLSLLAPLNIPVNLVTSSNKSITESHSPCVIVGTHALLYKNYGQNVGLLVIDEQHRFGVGQRAKLVEDSKVVPNTLTMTATPIPRTIALTLYGDLSLSTLNELPKGRKKITTWLVPEKKRDSAWKWIDKQIEKESIQVYVVCPLIDEGQSAQTMEVKNVTKEHKRLKKLLPNRNIGLLHGKIKQKEKTQILDDFKNKKFDILVATPVVEVGIDIPNATIMVIEEADRFGLAALHQLRGRVGRGEKKSYCLLFTENKSKKTKDRLSAMTRSHTGHELAEIDLLLRGPGEIFGTRQSGLPELRFARWNDFSLISEVKAVADKISDNKKAYKKVMKGFIEKQRAPN